MKEGKISRRDFLKFTTVLAGSGSLTYLFNRLLNGDIPPALAPDLCQDYIESARTYAEYATHTFPGLVYFSLDENLETEQVRTSSLTTLGDYTSREVQAVETTSSLRKYSPAFYNTVKDFPWGISLVDQCSIFDNQNNKWVSSGGTVFYNHGIYKIIIANNDCPTLHHEMWHFIQSIPPVVTWTDVDKGFGSINSQFRLRPYRVDWTVTQALQCHTNQSDIGYSNCYSHWNVNEDEANTAEYLMTVPTSYLKPDTPPAILAKRLFIENIYAQLSDGQMSHDFFNFPVAYNDPWGWPEMP